jgi:hypothetical protein
VIGSSSAYWNISPQHLSGTAFNLGHVSQSFYYDDRLMDRVLPQLPRLRRVIVAVSYLDLFFQLERGDEPERQYYYQQVWDIPPRLLRNRLDLRQWSDVALRTPSFALKSLFMALYSRVRGGPFQPPPLDPWVDQWGWCPRPTGERRNLTVASAQRSIAHSHAVLRLDDEADNLAHLEHMLATLRARGVEVVVLTSPVWKTFSSLMRPEVRGLAERHLSELCRRFGARFLPMIDTPELVEDDFTDPDHLSARGAIHLSRLIERRLTQPAPDDRSVGPGREEIVAGAREPDRR